METTIYYFGIGDELESFLKSQEIIDKIKSKDLEPLFKTRGTGFITAKTSKKDVTTQMLLISKEVYETFKTKKKRDYYDNDYTFVVETEDEIRQAVDTIYKTAEPVEPEVEEEPEEELTEEELIFGKKEEVEEVDVLNDDHKNDFIRPQVKRTQELEPGIVRMFTYEDTGSYGIEELVEVAGFEVTHTKMVEKLKNLSKKLTEAEDKLLDIQHQYTGYVDPSQVETLIKSIEAITNERDSIIEKYNKLVESGIEEKALKHDLIQEENKRVNMELKTTQDNLVTLQVELKNIEEYVKDLEAKSGLLEDDLKLARDLANSNAGKDVSSSQILKDNTMLANKANRLEKDLKNAHKEKGALKSQIENLILKLNTTSTNLAKVDGNYPNIEIWFSTSSGGNNNFYEAILTDKQFTNGKELLVDISNDSSLLKHIQLTKVVTPYKWLEGIDNNLDKCKVKGTNSDLDIITGVRHNQPRNLYTTDIDWQQKLRDLNKTKTILYLGSITNNDVYNFIKMLITNKVNISLYGVLTGNTSDINVDYQNLTDLNINDIKFVGMVDTKYNKLDVKLVYKKVGG